MCTIIQHTLSLSFSIILRVRNRTIESRVDFAMVWIPYQLCRPSNQSILRTSSGSCSDFSCISSLQYLFMSTKCRSTKLCNIYELSRLTLVCVAESGLVFLNTMDPYPLNFLRRYKHNWYFGAVIMSTSYGTLAIYQKWT